jgi:hypothetical protein
VTNVQTFREALTKGQLRPPGKSRSRLAERRFRDAPCE